MKRPLHAPEGELRRLLSLAWPVVLGQLGMMLMGVVDVIAVGHLGEDALAAVALGHTWSFGTTIVVLGTASGLDPMIAQAFGAGDRLGAGRTVVRGAVLLTLLAIPAIVLHRHADIGLGLLGQPAELLPIADAYCDVVAWSVLPMLGFSLLRQFLQGDGRMLPAAIAIVVCNVLNALLDYGLVYGRLGMPQLGAVGAGWATTGSRALMLVLLLGLGADLLRECWPGIRGVVTAKALWALAVVGVPVGVQVATEVWAFTGTTLLMGLLGKTAVAAHIVALNLCSLSFMVPMGIAAAAATRVGNLIGGGLPWARTGWMAIGLGAAAMGFSALAFVSAPGLLVALYTDELPVIALATTLLPLAALFQLFDGIQVVAFGVLRGAGDTRVPALANLVGYWVLGLPAGVWLAFYRDWGPPGLWIGLSVGLAIVAILLLLRLRATAVRGGYRVVAS